MSYDSESTPVGGSGAIEDWNVARGDDAPIPIAEVPLGTPEEKKPPRPEKLKGILDVYDLDRREPIHTVNIRNTPGF